MAQLDKIHDAVKNALIKDSWTITAESFQFNFFELELNGDFEAENKVDKIFIKIDRFFGSSIISDFENALGQFLLYRTVLSELKPDVKTYLAFSASNYYRFFKNNAIKTFIEAERLSFFAVNLEGEKIIKWND